MENKSKGSLKHLYVTMFLASFSGMVTMPGLTDVTMAALCPGQDECSFAIYLSAFHQAVTGIGSVVMTPLIGNLSDVYGRKALLTLPLTFSILPLVVLAYSRERGYFYAYYAFNTVASIIGQGSTHSLSLAYVADNVSEGKRASAFGVVAGVGSAAFVCGTLAARVLSIPQAFQVGALSATAGAVYMRFFLQETTTCSCPVDASTLPLPLLKSQPNITTTSLFQLINNNFPTIHDIKSLLRTSQTFSQIALMVFFNGLADGGLQASFMYYLKARFHFGKNQYAYLMLIVGTAGMISQLILMPMLEPIMSETRLLRMGLFVGCTNMLLNSIAWEVRIIYVVAGFSLFVIFTGPCMRSIASKQVGAGEQGKAQGCISGINSLANIIAPLVFSPLTAAFLSNSAPFNFPGFSLVCVAFCTAIAFIQSLMITSAPQLPTHQTAATA